MPVEQLLWGNHSREESRSGSNTNARCPVVCSVPVYSTCLVHKTGSNPSILAFAFPSCHQKAIPAWRAGLRRMSTYSSANFLLARSSCISLVVAGRPIAIRMLNASCCLGMVIPIDGDHLVGREGSLQSVPGDEEKVGDEGNGEGWLAPPDEARGLGNGRRSLRRTRG